MLLYLGKGGKIILWQQVTWPMLLGGNHLDHVFLKGEIWAMKSKTLNLSTVIIVRTWWEKKNSHKISSRGLTREVLFVILKCNYNMAFLINPCFHTFNWHLQVFIMQEEIQCHHSKLFPRFRVCISRGLHFKTFPGYTDNWSSRTLIGQSNFSVFFCPRRPVIGGVARE